MFTDKLYEYLDAVLDLGLTENEFWSMTLAELERFVASRKRVREYEEQKQKLEEQKRASFDYILADLIGKSVARVYNSSNKLPTIDAVYPSLFDTEEIQKAKAERERERFMAGLQQYAQTYNKDFEGVSEDK